MRAVLTSWTLGAAEVVWPAAAVLGECPVWSAREQALWWVDIKGYALHRFEPGSRRRTSWRSAEQIGCIEPPGEDGRLFAALQSGFGWLVAEPEGGDVRSVPVFDPEPSKTGNRFNDGKRAPDGSFWAGTMDDAEIETTGAWWRYDPETGRADRIDSGYKVTNGPAFDVAGEKVYLTDSARQTVYVADWRHGAGIENKRVFLTFGEGEGYPDGMQVDADGGLWIAFWDGACLRRFDPTGRLIQTVELPAQRPTSLAFTDDGKAIFVTSAGFGLNEAKGQGDLYRIPVLG